MDGDKSQLDITRRGVLLAGLGLALTACTSADKTAGIDRPDTPWPDRVNTPSNPGDALAMTPPQPVHAQPAGVRPPAAAPVSAAGFACIPRQQWTGARPIVSSINPMNGVSRITVHHEGWIPVYFTDESTTMARLQKIQSVHVRDRGWADIGYHFVIDRAGRVWEARNIRYQGAHVKNNNEHNVGVMCLGNFDQQQPSGPQVQQLVVVLRSLMQTYRVPVARVYTHQELNPTACPGKSLQARANAIRSSSVLA